jgi:YD repeat-containing protein
MLVRLPLAFLVFTCGVASRGAVEPLLAPGAHVEKIAGGFTHAEGPLWHPDGYLLFGDTPRDRIMRCDPAGVVSVFREPCGRTTALGWDPQGRLVANESHGGEEGARRVSRQEKDGHWATLADRYADRRLNSPNDLTIDGRGRIYFTDPRYSKRETMEQPGEWVFRIDPDGRLTAVIRTLTRPNGILVTRDGRTLFVADNPVTAGNAALWAFDLDADGNATNGRAVHDFHGPRGIDGMTLDKTGRIWAAAGANETAAILVFELDSARRAAKVVTTIGLPETPTNCTFGGARADELYITSDASLFRIRTSVQGQPTPPGK